MRRVAKRFTGLTLSGKLRALGFVYNLKDCMHDGLVCRRRVLLRQTSLSLASLTFHQSARLQNGFIEKVAIAARTCELNESLNGGAHLSIADQSS